MSVAAEVAHVLNTPITALLDMEWDDLLDWHGEAARIVKAKGSL